MPNATQDDTQATLDEVKRYRAKRAKLESKLAELDESLSERARAVLEALG